ncbi:MAG: zinc ribbon domain-containing protein [Patescibacteria group bacterium]
MEKHCEACGMPLIKKEDFAGGDENAKFCLYCVNADGSVKTCEEIFEGGVQFFLNQIGDDRNLAEKITRKNMNMQPYWQGKDCEILKGEMATDEEFAEVMKKWVKV